MSKFRLMPLFLMAPIGDSMRSDFERNELKANASNDIGPDLGDNESAPHDAIMKLLGLIKEKDCLGTAACSCKLFDSAMRSALSVPSLRI